ncbi:MAG: isoprenylcysteine carboxylmethyltransferase family protein [Chloroflexota bacterium]|nr:isoprenylcysteine carboxylmethyltransferase family protein [Chloroflexota bacterium]
MIQLALLALVAAAGVFLAPDWNGAPRLVSAAAGGALMVAGLIVVVLGIRDLDRSLTPLPYPAERGTLIEHGIYRRLRHPIYSGLVCFALGWGLLTASVAALGLTLALAVLLDLKARREEVWLRQRYAGYADYARRTSRFVPGVY